MTAGKSGIDGNGIFPVNTRDFDYNAYRSDREIEAGTKEAALAKKLSDVAEFAASLGIQPPEVGRAMKRYGENLDPQSRYDQYD